MKDLFKRFMKEESGATMVEYAILVALISVVAIVVIGTVGQSVLSAFTEVQSNLAAAASQ
jgi:pilus assembly protein Flp/PilA